MMHHLRLSAATAVILFTIAACGPAGPAESGHDHDAEHTAGSGDDHGHADGDAHTGVDDDHGHAGGDADGDGDAHTGVGDDHEGEGVIRLDERELAEFGIRLATAEPGVLRSTTALAGEIVLNPDRIAHVVSRAGGIGAEVVRTTGDHVEAGEALAVVESPELAESKAAYLSKAAEAALAATDLSRAETIHANTIQLLDIIAKNPDVDALRGHIADLDIGAKRGDLITAYAELRVAEAVYHREKTLFERQISSESEYLRAESELKKALAAFQAVRDDLAFANRRELEAARRSKTVAGVRLQAAERRLHAMGLGQSEVNAIEGESDLELARYEIRSPIAGRIIERHIVRGESLEAGQQVFVVADLSSVWGQLTLYQRDLADVGAGQTVRILGAHGFGDAEATIQYVSPILDEQTRTTTARVVLDNDDGDWRPGMFIRAILADAERRAAIAVPRTALQEIGGATVVFVQTPDGLVPRDVQIGRTAAASVEILAGLHRGERYVASGGLALKAELDKASLEHAGHAH